MFALLGRFSTHFIAATLGAGGALYISTDNFAQWVNYYFSKPLTQKRLKESIKPLEKNVDEVKKSIEPLHEDITSIKQNSLILQGIDPETLIQKGFNGLLKHFGAKNTKIISNKAIDIVASKCTHPVLFLFGNEISIDSDSANPSKFALLSLLPYSKDSNVTYHGTDEKIETEYLVLKHSSEMPKNIDASHVLRVNEDGSLEYDEEAFLNNADLEGVLPEYISFN